MYTKLLIFLKCFWGKSISPNPTNKSATISIFLYKNDNFCYTKLYQNVHQNAPIVTDFQKFLRELYTTQQACNYNHHFLYEKWYFL